MVLIVTPTPARTSGSFCFAPPIEVWVVFDFRFTRAYPAFCATTMSARLSTRLLSPISSLATVGTVTAAAADRPDHPDQSDRPTLVDQALRDLTDDQRRSDAAEARRREQWLRRQSEEEGTFHGVLTDLVERRAPVAVHTGAGRVLRGELHTLGLDFVVVAGPGGERTVVPVTALTSVHPEPGTKSTVGDRRGCTTATLDVTLVELASDRPAVSVHTVSAERVMGRLWWVGRDVICIRADAAEHYLPMSSLNDVTLG